MASGEEPPWAMMVMPLTPSKGIPPYSSALVSSRTLRKAGRQSSAPSLADRVCGQFALEQPEHPFRQRL